MQQQLVEKHPFTEREVVVRDGRVQLLREEVLASEKMDQLVREAVFGSDGVRDQARWLIWELGQRVGVRAASIHELYMARGRREIGGFTVPAINLRVVTYDAAR